MLGSCLLGFVLTGIGSGLAWFDGQQKEQKAERRERENQKTIVKLQEDLLKSKDETISAITGGDSFCYAALEILPASKNEFGLVLLRKGKYPLYDLQARIVDVNAQPEAPGQAREPEYGKTLNVGNLAPGVSVTLPIKLSGASGSIALNIFFTARNGEFTNLFRVRKIGDDWVTAARVTAPSTPPDHVVHITRDGELQLPPDKVLYEFIDRRFPRNSQGKIEW
jgi:hypothetical protein